MSKPLNPIQIRNIGLFGTVRQAEVDDNLIPDGAVTEAVNFNFDRKGAAVVRPGMVALGGTAIANAGVNHNGRWVGIHNALGSVILAAFDPVVGGGSQTIVIYISDSDGWRIGGSVSFTSTSAKVRFLDFSNYTLAFNGRDLAKFATYPFSSWSTGGSPLGSPPANFIFAEVYKSRIYAVQADGNAIPSYTKGLSRLYFSSVISSGGNITWNTTTDYVDINPGDGESITALKRYSLELLCFKPNYIYRFRTTGVDPDPLIKIGTRSNESVIEGKRGLYFLHETGFYRYSGGYPTEISRPISDIVKAIPFSQLDDAPAWKDSDHIYWSLGNLTIPELKQTVTWKNVVVRYTESSDVWTVYSYASDIRVATTYTSPSTINISPVVGFGDGTTGAGNNGVIAVLNAGTTDLGEAIIHRLITKFYDWNSIATRKIIKELVTICEKATDMHIMYQIDDSIEWNELGQLTSFLTYFRKDTKPFHKIRFKISGVTKSEAAIFQGIEVLSGIDEGNLLGL